MNTFGSIVYIECVAQAKKTIKHPLCPLFVSVTDFNQILPSLIHRPLLPAEF